MSDPTQRCPSSWQTFTSPRPSCGKKADSVPCDSVSINTCGASYQMICGRFGGYQVGEPDGFASYAGLGSSLETYYVDGVSITYGSLGNRHHVYTYAAGLTEISINLGVCPCAGGASPPPFIGSKYYCESGNPLSTFNKTAFYYSDLIWDGQLCRNGEVACCEQPSLPWFCNTLATPISEDLEVRICLDEPLNTENVAIEFFELYILASIGAPINVTAITLTPTSINISWNANKINNCVTITLYEVKYTWPLQSGQLGVSYMNTSGAQTQLVLSALQECVQYNISVRAYTSQGPGPFSEPVLDSSLNVHAQVPQPPEVPVNALTSSSANLTWSCPLEKNCTITSYSVNITVVSPRLVDVSCLNGQNFSYYITVPGYQRYLELQSMLLSMSPPCLCTNNPSVALMSPVPYTEYTFDVLANTAVGDGKVSIPQSFTTLQAPPTPPLNVTVGSLSYSSLRVSWSPPKCSNGIISEYIVMYSPPTGSPTSPYSVTNTSTILLQNMLSNTMYTISLCACTAGACGPDVVVTATTPSVPPSKPIVAYLRASLLTNVDNHQNDEAISLCRNDVINGWSRIECKIIIFLNLNIQTFLYSMDSMIANVSSIRIANSLNLHLSAIEFCSCDLNLSNGDRGTYSWPEVATGQTISQMCQYGVVGQNITRFCNGDLKWTEDASQCPTIVTSQFNELNTAIQNQTITALNMVNITTQLQSLVSQATQEVDQSVSNLAVVTNVITQISNISSPEVPIQAETIINVVTVLSSIQTWPSSVLSTNGPVLVENFEIIATNLVQQKNYTKIQITKNKAISLETLSTEGKNYSTEDEKHTQGGITNTSTDPNFLKLTASVALPASLFSSIKANSNVTYIGIFISIYTTASFFPLANHVFNDIIVAPLVIGVTVVGGMTNNLTDPVVLIFTIPNKNYSNYSCVSWDFFAAGGKGNWTTDGCVTNLHQSNLAVSKIQCKCFHLTNFAILVDISRRVQPNQQLDKVVHGALEVISYIGVALSLSGLVLALITLLMIKKLRQKDVTKYHIQLCCALIGMLLVFVIGIDRTENFGGCVAVSVLIHYFTLAAVMWMGAEAVLMFQKIVIVFARITTRYIIAVSFICWAVPFVPVLIPLSIDRNLLLAVRHNSTEGYCFINNVPAFFAAFLGPILLVLAFNAIIFVVVILTLVKHLIKRSKEPMNHFGTVKLISNISGICCLLGLTWVFGALTITKADQAFQIMFTVTNSLQGFFIFIFFCVLNGDVRSAWVMSLPCKCRTTKTISNTKEPPKQCTVGLTLPVHNHSNSKESEYIVKSTYCHGEEQVELNIIIRNADMELKQ
ncbi:hypothetical protein EMCRGX_G026114 [Ephydatia muelleri]